MAAVAAAQKAHPELRVEEMGDESLTKASVEKSNEEMGKSDTHLAAADTGHAGVRVRRARGRRHPDAAGADRRGATLGLLGPVSQIAPVDGSVMQVVLLVGMAVGVDYACST